MITAKEMVKFSKGDISVDVLNNEHALLNICTWVIEAGIKGVAGVMYESQEYYLNETPESIYIHSMLRQLGYKVSLYSNLNKFGMRESGIYISW